MSTCSGPTASCRRLRASSVALRASSVARTITRRARSVNRFTMTASREPADVGPEDISDVVGQPQNWTARHASPLLPPLALSRSERNAAGIGAASLGDWW